jgi:hypothetical protein
MSDDPDIGTSPDSPIALSPVPNPLTIQYTQRSLTMLPVSTTELDAIASLGSSVHLTFFGLCAGAALTCAVVLTTVTITNPITYGGYVGALIFSGVLGIYFGIRGVVDHRASKRKLRDIKSGK